MDPNQRQRKRGAVDRINSAVNTAKNLRNAVLPAGIEKQKPQRGATMLNGSKV